MPDYDSLAKQGIYQDLTFTGAGQTGMSDISVFAGTVADPFFIDLGAAFDSFNFRSGAGGGVLTPSQDANNYLNLAPNAVAGFNVNTIAIEIPIKYLTSDFKVHAGTDPKAHDWRVGNHVQTADDDPSFAESCHYLGCFLPGSEAGQPPSQRIGDRYRFQGSLEHGAAGQRCSIRKLRS